MGFEGRSQSTGGAVVLSAKSGGEPGRLEVWEGVAALLRRTPRAWERVEVGATGWTGGGAVVDGIDIAEPGWITRSEKAACVEDPAATEGMGRAGHLGWDDPRTEYRGAD